MEGRRLGLASNQVVEISAGRFAPASDAEDSCQAHQGDRTRLRYECGRGEGDAAEGGVRRAGRQHRERRGGAGVGDGYQVGLRRAGRAGAAVGVERGGIEDDVAEPIDHAGQARRAGVAFAGVAHVIPHAQRVLELPSVGDGVRVGIDIDVLLDAARGREIVRPVELAASAM